MLVRKDIIVTLSNNYCLCDRSCRSITSSVMVNPQCRRVCRTTGEILISCIAAIITFLRSLDEVVDTVVMVDAFCRILLHNCDLNRPFDPANAFQREI